MGKVGGNRNFGYGKQMAWAGGQAVADRYGQGHYGTVAAHTERWGQFAAWARMNGVRDAREVTTGVVIDFGRELAEQVREGTTASPAGLDRETVARCAAALRETGQDRVASVAELARDLGLRAREASMLDARAALREAPRHGAVNVTAGTKGGRGNRVDRWVPVSERASETIRRAAAVQGPGRNLIPAALDWRQWNDRLHRVWAEVRGEHGLARLHDLRAAYACDRYRQITGCAAPVVAGAEVAARDADRAARQFIAEELGHSRIEVVAAYVGSAR